MNPEIFSWEGDGGEGEERVLWTSGKGRGQAREREIAQCMHRSDKSANFQCLINLSMSKGVCRLALKHFADLSLSLIHI